MPDDGVDFSDELQLEDEVGLEDEVELELEDGDEVEDEDEKDGTHGPSSSCSSAHAELMGQGASCASTINCRLLEGTFTFVKCMLVCEYY